MKYNFEFGTPVHIPEEPNSFERPPQKYYDEYFKKIQEHSEAYMESDRHTSIRVAPETYYAEVDRADALEVALAVSDKERDELMQANAVLLQDNDKLSQENQLLREEIKNIRNEPAGVERIYALPTEPSLRRLNAQKMGHIASKLS